MWHGGTWNFVLWGLFHGVFLIFERIGFEKVLSKSRLIGHVYTLLVVLLAWVLFRIPEWSAAVDFYQSLVRIQPINEGLLLSELLDREYIIMFGFGVFLSMPVKNSLLKIRNQFSPELMALVEYPVMAFYLLLFVLSAMSIASSTYNPFIYFRF
jgi:alginate O-acetyltransferase complex protein AlgI